MLTIFNVSCRAAFTFSSAIDDCLNVVAFYRVRYNDLVVVPVAVSTYKRYIELLIKCRHRNVKSVHLVFIAIAVNNFIGGRFKQLSAFFLSILS